VEGNRVAEVYQAVEKAVARARRGEGPSLIECKTMRMVGHGTHDPATYLPVAEVEKWKKKDPILLLDQELSQQGILSEAEKKKIKTKIEKEIEEAVEYARLQPMPTPEDLPCL